MSLCGPGPSPLRQDHRNGLIGDQLGLVEGLSCFTFDERRPPLITIGFGVFNNFILDHSLQA